MPRSPGYCAIDFGTSNSAIAVPVPRAPMRLVQLEPGFATMPTAVFYAAEGGARDQPHCEFGRAAVA
ncbi:MAG: heat-shock protein, partial [Pseudomonadota bacterium]|nr:heat-shock protein [Pseudomonadota bacterium]